MERQKRDQRSSTVKPKRKRKNNDSNLETATSAALALPQHVSSRHHIFPLMVAALRAATTAITITTANNYYQLLDQLLNQLHLSLLAGNLTPLTLPVPVLSLLPVLLTSKCANIVRKCADFVGAASLFSVEMNDQIANDEDTVNGLVSALASWKRRKRSTSIAVCNAVLDMSTTSVGSCRLLESSALDCLIFCFLQVPKSSNSVVSVFCEDNGSESRHRIGFKEDELPVLLLDAAITLVNACKIDQLEKITGKLLENLFAYLKKLWPIVRAQVLLGRITIRKYSQERHFFDSNITKSNLAECIFRLSINEDQHTAQLHMGIVKRNFFSWDGSTFEQFILNHWEVSPLFMRRFSEAFNDKNDIFSSVKHSLNFNETSPFLSTILRSLISCPPIDSDELDIISFLKETRSHLGCPMIYQQDIRVLKAHHLTKELHFFQEDSRSCCFQDPHFLYTGDVLKCEDAYKEGYTIALRGMGFRSGSIAAMVDGLAHLFGQPSAGVNMYLTPRNSQGLACHFDDHCVFVCQLFGAKQWKVSCKSSLWLPRLYETNDRLQETHSSTTDEYRHFLLKEGDVLYIPRGFRHEACTVVNNESPCETSEFSLHLTLGIEVEPPFEWEGFAHVAFHYWYQNQRQSSCTPCESFNGSLNCIFMNLMHVVIKLIGDADPTFRKACLVGAISFVSDSKDWLDLNQRTVFVHLIKGIDANSRFSDALSYVTLSLKENEDPLRHVRWLQHVEDEEEFTSCLSEHVVICNRRKEEAEAAFMAVKSKFCSEVVFDDVGHCYKILLEKYRKVRQQYTRGMVSLHCN